jgi:hypothetical protein
MNVSFDSSDDGDGRAELFTPIRGRRKSLVEDFTPTPSHSTATEESTPAPKTKNKNINRKSRAKDKDNNKSASFFADDTPNTLPKLHDTSWLGAGMSPIRKERDDILENNGADEHENEDAAVVAPYRLGLTETSASSVAASESFFLDVDGETDDFEENNSKEQTPQNTNNGNRSAFAATQKATVDGREAASKGYIRPPLPLLLHPRTTATTKHGDDFGAAREKDKYGHNQQRRRRRRLLNPFQRKFWTFWSALTSSPSENSSENNPSSSYVMIDGPPRLATTGSIGISIRRGNVFVIGATAFVLFCVGMHDIFLVYLAMRRGITASEQRYGLAWTLPWIGPTQRSLLRFGAFSPERLLPASSSAPEYWRSFTSMVVPISLVEWLLLVWVWTRYLPSSLFSPATNFSWQLSWPVVYLLSALTGQLWMMAFHYEIIHSSVAQDANAYEFSLPALSGCAGWATAGVLCAVGIQAPNRRFPCFVSSIALVVLHQCQATGSVIGCSAASFFGWAYSGLWAQLSPAVAVMSLKRWQQQQREMLLHDYTYYHDVLHDGGNAMDEKSRWNLWHVLAAIFVFLLWFSPIMFLLYR